MASSGFLFVNDDAKTVNKSRKGTKEAQRINRYVQQQRLYKQGSRQNWYRPFTRTESTTPESQYLPTPVHSPAHSWPPGQSPGSSADAGQLEGQQISPISYNWPVTTEPGSGLGESENEYVSSLDDVYLPLTPFAHIPGGSVDPFQCTIIPMTPVAIEVLQRHVTWVFDSAISQYTVTKGMESIGNVILQDEMHATSFIAFATAQASKTYGITLPHENSPQYYTYKSTKLIRRHIDKHANSPSIHSPYLLMDIFRTAMAEWMIGNAAAARVHFAYIVRSLERFKQDGATAHHVIEVVSSADLWMSIDLDEKPLMDRSWSLDLNLPGFIIEDDISLEDQGGSTTFGEGLVTVARSLHVANISGLIVDLVNDLRRFPAFSTINFATATEGPTWIMKRKMHSMIHQLVPLNEQKPSTTIASSLEGCLKLVILMILFFASTTPSRRVGRVDTGKLALRLKTALIKFERTHSAQPESAQDPTFWAWLYLTGLSSAKQAAIPKGWDDTQRQDLILWFTKRAKMAIAQSPRCGSWANSKDIANALQHFLYFDVVFMDAIRYVTAKT